MASRTSTGDVNQIAAEHIFKLLKEQAGVDTASDQSDFEQVIDKLRLTIEGGTAARGGTDTPEMTNALRSQMFSFTNDVRAFFGKININPLPAPNPAAAQSAQAAAKTQREANTGAVTAFDRPQSVVVVGPRPLPVYVVNKQGGGGNGNPPEKPDSIPGLGNAAKGISLLTSGMAAMSQAITAAATTTTAMIDVIGTYIGSVQKLNQMVEKFDPGTAYLFGQAVENVQAAIGRLLVPALQQATVILNFVNQALTRLGPDSKTMIAAMAGAGAALVTLGAAVSAMFVAMAGALTVVGVAISIATAGIADIFGILGAGLAAIAIGGASAGAGLATFTALTADVKKMLAILEPILRVVINSLERMSPRFLELSERVAPVVIQLVELVAMFVEMVVAIASVRGVIEAVGVAALVAAASFMVMLAPLVLIAAAAIGATLAIYTLLRAMGVISEIKVGDKKNMTLSAQPATFSSAQSMAEKTYASAYSLGTGEANPMIQSNADLLGGIKGLTGWIESLVTEVRLWLIAINNIKNNPLGALKDAAKGAVPNDSFRGFVGGALGAFPGLGDVGKLLGGLTR